jgi:hypothetical protein
MSLLSFYPEASEVGETHTLIPATEFFYALHQWGIHRETCEFSLDKVTQSMQTNALSGLCLLKKDSKS